MAILVQLNRMLNGRDKDGEEILRCYQVSGGSVSGEKVGWKILKVHEVFSLNLLKEKFDVRTGYKRGDKAMNIVCASGRKLKNCSFRL